MKTRSVVIEVNESIDRTLVNDLAFVNDVRSHGAQQANSSKDKCCIEAATPVGQGEETADISD